MYTDDFNANPSDTSSQQSYDMPDAASENTSPSLLNQGGNMGQSSLLDEIATDEPVEEPEKKKESVKSMFLVGMSLLMKAIFYLDHQRRLYPMPFKILKTCWLGLSCFLLFMGALGFFLLFSLWLSFSGALEKGLKDLGVQAKSMTFTQTGFSQTVIENLTDKKGTYTIKKIVLNYSLSELLKKRIKEVKISDVKITGKEDENGFYFGDLPGILTNMMQNPVVHIESLSVSGASLEVNGKNATIPLTFSVSGVMSKKAALVVPFSIKQDEIQANGSLEISGAPQKRNYVLTITNGILTLPKKAPENFAATLNIETVKGQTKKITGELDSTYGKNTKKFELDLERNATGKLEGSLNVNLNNIDLYDKANEFKTNVKLVFKDIAFVSDIHHIISTEPITINVYSFENKEVRVSAATATLLGKLECKNFACNYVLTAPANVSAKGLKVKLNRQTYTSLKEVMFLLLPSKNKEIFRWDNDQFTFDLILQNLIFLGFRDIVSNGIDLQAGLMSVKGTYNGNDGFGTIPVRMERLDYASTDVGVKGAILNIADFNNANAALDFQTSSFTLKNSDLFKNPISLKVKHTDQKTLMNVGLENDVIKIYLDGKADMIRDEFAGNITSQIALNTMKKPLSSISGLFPEFIREPTGQISVLGEMTWKNAKQIMGPVYVGLKNVGFKNANQQFEGINAVVLLKSVVPFTTGDNQHLFMQRVRGAVPLQNSSVVFKAENQMFLILSVKTQLGMIPLTAGASLIPFNTDQSVINLSNGSVQVADVERSLTDSLWGGTGSFTASIPLEIGANGLAIKGGTLSKPLGVQLTQKVRNNANLINFFENNPKYDMSKGTITLNTNAQTGMTNVQLALERKRGTGMTEGLYKKTMDVSLENLLWTDRTAPIPKDIVERQQLLFK